VFRKAGKLRSTAAVQPAQATHLTELLRTSLTASPAPAASAAALDSSAIATDRHPPAQTSASELLARAESERRRGQLEQARALYRQASAKYHEDDAEVALLRWVRMELDARAFGSAQRVLRDHARRFAGGKLKAEAAWLGVSILREQGQADSARTAARKLLTQFPEAPQADAARQWLAQP
jgi:Tfp pilus assembly protein PilF